MSDPIRILMIEDHPEYRHGISIALETEEDLELISTFGTAERALRSLENPRERQEPDVVLLDLNLPGMSGLEALPWLQKTIPAARVIVLTQSDHEADVMKAISSGAAGYLLKSASLEQITDGIRTVVEGGASLDAGIAKFILTTLQRKAPPEEPDASLSNRELEILNLLGEGLVKKEIAHKLEISTATVATHVRHIYEKLEVQNAPAAITRAYRTGILPADEGPEESDA